MLSLPYEMLAADADGFLERVGEFAGIRSMRKPPTDKVNESIPSLALAMKRHANRLFVRDTTNVAPILAFDNSRRTIQNVFWNVARILPRRSLDSHELRWKKFASKQTSGRYAESNRITAEITGLDLGSYGYEMPVT